MLAEQFAGLVGILFRKLPYFAFQFRTNMYVFPLAFQVVGMLPTDGQRRRIVGGPLHLVDIPVGLQVFQITDARVGAQALYLMIIP